MVRAQDGCAPTLLFSKALGGILSPSRARAEHPSKGGSREHIGAIVLDSSLASAAVEESAALEKVTAEFSNQADNAPPAGSSSSLIFDCSTTCTSETEAGQTPPTASPHCMDTRSDDELEPSTSILFGDFGDAEAEPEAPWQATSVSFGDFLPDTPEWSPRHASPAIQPNGSVADTPHPQIDALQQVVVSLKNFRTVQEYSASECDAVPPRSAAHHCAEEIWCSAPPIPPSGRLLAPSADQACSEANGHPWCSAPPTGQLLAQSADTTECSEANCGLWYSAPIAGPVSLPAQIAVQQCGEAASGSWYRIAYLGGMELRVSPSFAAARTGQMLHQDDVFHVAQEIVGADGRIYLQLSDGRGWVFDDSALLPHDPSVARIGLWAAPATAPFPAMPAQAVPGPAPLGSHEQAGPTSMPVSSTAWLHEQAGPWYQCSPLHHEHHVLAGPMSTAPVVNGESHAAPSLPQWNYESGPPPWDA